MEFILICGNIYEFYDVFLRDMDEDPKIKTHPEEHFFRAFGRGLIIPYYIRKEYKAWNFKQNMKDPEFKALYAEKQKRKAEKKAEKKRKEELASKEFDEMKEDILSTLFHRKKKTQKEKEKMRKSLGKTNVEHYD